MSIAFSSHETTRDEMRAKLRRELRLSRGESPDAEPATDLDGQGDGDPSTGLRAIEQQILAVVRREKFTVASRLAWIEPLLQQWDKESKDAQKRASDDKFPQIQHAITPGSAGMSPAVAASLSPWERNIIACCDNLSRDIAERQRQQRDESYAARVPDLMRSEMADLIRQR